jgi:outer membrane receptor protein involved in Fe transport
VDVSFSRARFTDNGGAAPYIPGALDRVVSAGLTTTAAARLSGSVRLRHFGPRPLTENGAVKSRATTVVNAEGGLRFARRARLALEAFNLFDTDASDIDYYYTSRLPGEPEGGVDDLHTHPALPRSLRLELQLRF